MKKIFFAAILAPIILLGNAYALEPVSTDGESTASESLFLSDTGKRYLRNGVIVSAIPVTFLVSSEIWGWNDTYHFKTRNEGMFGVNTDYAGHDKACHFYAHYLVERSLINLFDYTENGDFSKYLFATAITTSIGVFIEVGDGFSSSYGFGFGDLLMDMSGILTAATLEYFPKASSFVGVSCEYFPTKAFRHSINNSSTSPLTFINDYSGWKFLINFKLAGFADMGWNIPDFLRYVQFDVGFTTEGYTNIDEDYYGVGNHERKRHLFVGISLNSAEAARSFFKKGSTAGKIVSTPLEYYHLPIGYCKDINTATSTKTARHE